MEPEWIFKLVEKLQTISEQQRAEEAFEALPFSRTGNSMEIEETCEQSLNSMEYSQNETTSTHFLCVPQITHNYLMSPPPSPPENWHQGSEDINRIPFIDLNPIYVSETNQTILFRGFNDIDPRKRQSMDNQSIRSSQRSSVCSSEYSSLNSSTSSLPSCESPRRPKRKQDDQSRVPITQMNMFQFDSHLTWLEEDPLVTQEKEERKRRNNLRQNRRQLSFSSTSTSAPFTIEDQSSSEEEMLSLPSIVVTHDLPPF